MKLVTAFCVGLAILLVGCSSNERSKSDSKAAQESPSEEAPSASDLKGKVWVAKPDGSKSCGTQSGMTPDQAATELAKAGVKVYQKQAGNDGMMHMMVCGAETGNTVEAQIDGEQYDAAAKLGYKLKAK